MWRLYKTTYDHDWDEPIVERIVIMEDKSEALLLNACACLTLANPLPEPTYTRIKRPYAQYTVEGCN